MNNIETDRVPGRVQSGSIWRPRRSRRRSSAGTGALQNIDARRAGWSNTSARWRHARPRSSPEVEGGKGREGSGRPTSPGSPTSTSSKPKPLTGSPPQPRRTATQKANEDYETLRAKVLEVRPQWKQRHRRSTPGPRRCLGPDRPGGPAMIVRQRTYRGKPDRAAYPRLRSDFSLLLRAASPATMAGMATYFSEYFGTGRKSVEGHGAFDIVARNRPTPLH